MIKYLILTICFLLGGARLVSGGSDDSFRKMVPKGSVADVYKRLDGISSGRVAHDFKLRGSVVSIDLLTKCLIAGTPSEFRLIDALGSATTMAEIQGKVIPWEPRFDKFTATQLLKYTLDQNSWSLEIREVDSITIIRGVL